MPSPPSICPCSDFINSSLGNRFFDRLMPWASDPPGLTALLLLACLGLIWKGGARGRICVLMLALALVPGQLAGVRLDETRGRPIAPVSSAARRVICASARAEVSACRPPTPPIGSALTLILLVYYRRTIWFMLPLALLVCLSRVYNGVHYPSDVLAGALLGAGYSAAVIWGLEALWQSHRLPLVSHLAGPAAFSGAPGRTGAAGRGAARSNGFALAAPGVSARSRLFFGLRLAYLASGKIELSEDEAYQWIWSKHPALSYYSKPPLIACAQFLGTHLWGDNEFGVRFFSPVIAAVLSVLVLRFLARQASGRLAFIVFLIITVTPADRAWARP